MSLKKTLILALTAAVTVTMVGVSPDMAMAKAKKGKGDTVDPELQKEVDGVSATLMKLLVKAKSHGLFSPEEAGKVTEIKLQMMDLLAKAGQDPLLVKPVYQAGVLFAEREQYDDAMDMFRFLTTNFAEHPYGLQAKAALAVLEKQMGIASTASVPGTAPGAPPAAPGAPPAKG